MLENTVSESLSINTRNGSFICNDHHLVRCICAVVAKKKELSMIDKYVDTLRRPLHLHFLSRLKARLTIG